MDRRQFCQLSGLSLAQLYFGSSLAAKKSSERSGFLLTSGKVKKDQGSRQVIVKVDLASGHPTYCEIPFEAHGFFQNLKSKHIWYVAGKRPSKLSAVVDIHKMKVIKFLKSQPGYRFYGHGCRLSSGDLVFVEQGGSGSEGLLSIRSHQEDLTLSKISGFGTGVHDVCLTPKENIVAASVNNYDNKEFSEISFLDLKAKSLTSKIKSYSSTAGIEHFTIKDGWVFAGIFNQGDYKEIDSYIGVAKLGDKTFRPLSVPKESIKNFNKGTLSIAVDSHKKEVYLTTSKFDNDDSSRGMHVYGWNYESGNFLFSKKFSDTKGVVLSPDNKNLWCSNSKNKITDLRSNKEIVLTGEPKFLRFGSHLYYYL